MPGVGRLRRSIDFERALGQPPCARSTHFAIHHLADRPSAPAGASPQARTRKLSTAEAAYSSLPVDDLAEGGLISVAGIWLGTVLPKRHARRSVTRSLLKRRIRAAVGRRLGELPAGLWVVRLRLAFDPQRFSSAASPALGAAADDELQQLIGRASRAGRASA